MSPISTIYCRSRSWPESFATIHLRIAFFFVIAAQKPMKLPLNWRGATARRISAANTRFSPPTIPFNDLRAAEEAIDPEKTVGILVEPIQGEGGVNVPDEDYLRGLRELCDRRNLLLIFDEVQTGLGRTGKLFGYEHFGMTPDIMTLAKALGGGLPLGAMLAREEVAQSFIPGSHASTFGGNPLVCNVGLAVLKTLLKGGVLKNCVKMEKVFVRGLSELKDRFSFVKSIRGKGLILGLELEIEGAKIVDACMQAGLLINCTAYKVLRFVPPLTINQKEIERGLGILDKVLARQ